MTCCEKRWSDIIDRFKKVESVEFFVQKVLVTIDDPEEILFLRTLALKKIEALEREYSTEVK